MGELSKDRLWYALMSPNPSDRGAAAVQVVERATKKKGAGCSADGLLMASEVTALLRDTEDAARLPNIG